jgi:hypothetical protein
MSRVVKIQKVGKSTIIEIINDNVTSEVFVINKLTNVSLRNGCINVCAPEIKVFIQYNEIFDKLASTDIKDYLHKAAAIFLFNQ